MNQYNDLFKEHYTELERLRQVERDYAAFYFATKTLLNHIACVVDRSTFEEIEGEKWDAVSMTKLNKQEE